MSFFPDFVYGKGEIRNERLLEGSYTEVIDLFLWIQWRDQTNSVKNLYSGQKIGGGQALGGLCI